MRPRIFIAIHYMHLGGAEISLIGLLQALDQEKVDVDLFVYSHEGYLMTCIPEYVNLLPEIKSYSMLERPMVEVLSKGHLGVLAARLWSKHLASNYIKKRKITKENSVGMGYLGKYFNKIVPDINPSVTYDLAISFLIPHNIVLDHVKAKKKICWIHTDYSNVKINQEVEFPVWSRYDYIASISSRVTNSFIKIFPSLKNKIIEIENILSPDFVRKRAEEYIITNFEGDINLLSIGRFCEAKNYDNIPDICKRMLTILKSKANENENINKKLSSTLPLSLKWYIIGFGPDEELIHQKIAEAGMQEHVIILGKKENPYPYIKACDIYVQPSRYEGKSVTVREAQMLCKPVVVTNYPTASSQIEDGVDGVIVPLDNDGCAKGLADFILDKAKQKEIDSYLKKHDYGNIKETEKIYELL